ncbi:hypothetical protein DKP78_21365, partial [Enterococcus faecium]
FLSCVINDQSQCCGGGVGVRRLFDKPLGYIAVGNLDLFVTGTGVGELLAGVGIAQVLPDARHILGNLKTSVFLGHNLHNVKLGEKV